MLAAKFDTQSRKAGAKVFEESSIGDAAYVVGCGEVEILSSDGGRKALMATLGKGELFGEISRIETVPAAPRPMRPMSNGHCPLSRPAAQGDSAKAHSIARTMLGYSGSWAGSKPPTRRPRRSSRNLAKFQVAGPTCSGPAVGAANTGD